MRLSFDILRPVPVAPVRVTARHLRPGRRVELVEATLTGAADNEPLMRLTAWRMRAEAVPLPDGLGASDPPPAPPETGEPGSFSFWREPVAYHRALDWRFVAGQFESPGPATVWTRMQAPLVLGEETTPLEHLLVMTDAASGVSSVLDWGAWIFINVDLDVHLERAPAGDWMAMDATTRIGPAGTGLCTAVLHDASGRVGTSAQSLLVAPR